MVERHPSRAGSSATDGFTLIELLVVLTIIGLLIVAVPAVISSARPGVEARVAAQTLAHDLRAARAEAIASNREIKVIFDRAHGSYLIVPSEQRVQLSRVLKLDFQDASGGKASRATELTFFEDGSSSGARIRISSAKRHYWIVTTPLTGKVSVDE